MYINGHRCTLDFVTLAQIKQPFRPEIGPEVTEMLEDFCNAHHEASPTEVVRKAVRDFILRDIGMNDAIRLAYLGAQAARRK
jgi:hypothetical protein